MAIIRCPQGHYYDDEKFSRCPHCSVFTSASLNSADSRAKKPEETIVLKSVMDQGVDNDQKTVGIYSSSKGNDYVTGWLVCVKGPELGRDYKLRHGFNRIGRSFSMSVCIEADQFVSRETHCSIAYDDRANNFSIVPSSGTLTYLNGELLKEPEEIKAGDLVQIGESEFEFVAFCREGRIWKDLEENG